MSKKTFGERFVRWTARSCAKGTVGLGYMTLRGLYSLGDAGAMFCEEFSLESERLTKKHEAEMARIEVVKAKMQAMINERNAASATTV